jgi:hypothetical protein
VRCDPEPRGLSGTILRAGMRFREYIALDMVAVRVSPD